MQADEQGTRGDVVDAPSAGKPPRYHVIPRTLILLTHTDPDNGARNVLLLKGAPTKRLWANRYNGLGGHVEAGEDVLAAAQRELREEAGIAEVALTLAGVVNIDTGADADGPRPGVMMFVLVGESPTRAIRPGPEGTPEWLPLARLDEYPLVDDLRSLLPLALTPGGFCYGHYTPQPDGSLAYHFRRA
jgi:8-oxo-dGTP diphosphatase